ncbi:MAG: hypothetical protein HOE90_15820 [Bacteriovoracaceae bacterium]|nr:hypothetical protein [Bacteriovoracaceae bacterium]
MKRPHLVHFISLASQTSINIRASLTLAEKSKLSIFDSAVAPNSLTTPRQSLGLLSRQHFRMKIVGLNVYGDQIFSKVFNSDSFGNFTFKIPQGEQNGKIAHLLAFETSFYSGLEIHLGAFIPIKVERPLKLVISDFDKTLVDTRYSSAKDLYRSLNRPLSYFPRVDASIDLIRGYINSGHQPFILTASPHFYENALRDWLYKNEIFTAGIFLKDYRHVFSFDDGLLTTKDIKNQGFYKLNHLVNILLLTGIPEELVLMGDGFESDMLIYKSLALLLKDEVEPWTLWNKLRGLGPFQLTTKQNSRFLNKIYQLDSLLKSSGSPDPLITIHIRCKKEMELPKMPLEIFNRAKVDVRRYQA